MRVVDVEALDVDEEIVRPTGPNGAADDASAKAEWPVPDMEVLQLSRRPPPVLPLEIFGYTWRQWIEATARSAACPVDYVVAPLLAAASSMIGNARWAQAWDGWEEPPHLWCASVGDSGDGKSPGADLLYRYVLPEMERREAEGFPELLAKARAAREVAEAQEAEFRAEVRAARKEGREPPAPPLIVKPEEPVEPRLVFGDVTIERVANLLATTAHKGVLMSRDELAGWFLGMTAYNDGARAFWLEAYGGRPYRLDRVKHPKPLKIRHFAIAWHGGIQPGRLVEVMRGADDGLLSRFMWFWPDPPEFARGGASRPDLAIEAFDRLRKLRLDSDGKPVCVPLDAAAAERMEEFARALQRRKRGAGGLMRSTIGKARGLALRLSLVLAFLEWAAGPDANPPELITEPAFARAITFVLRYAMPMAERVFGGAERSEAEQDAATLAKWIVSHTAVDRPREIHVRVMQRKVRLPGLVDAEKIHAACRVLVDADWLAPPVAGKQQHRARQAYIINPRVYEGERA